MKKTMLLLSALVAIGTTGLFLATPNVNAQARIAGPATNTATSTAAAATINGQSGIVTTEALATAAGADYTFALTNSDIKNGATTIIYAWIKNGSNTGGSPSIGRVQSTAAGSATIVVHNGGAAAFNGTLLIGFLLLSP
jgi:hypothetical protein